MADSNYAAFVSVVYKLIATATVHIATSYIFSFFAEWGRCLQRLCVFFPLLSALVAEKRGDVALGWISMVVWIKYLLDAQLGMWLYFALYPLLTTASRLWLLFPSVLRSVYCHCHRLRSHLLRSQ